MIKLPKTRLFWSVSLGHFANDTFMSMGPVILAFLSVSLLPMSNTQIGLTITAAQFTGGVSQPLFGWMADRTGGRSQGIGGVALTAGFLALALVAAQTGHFWLMFVPFVARGIGSAAFHPSGVLHAAESDSQRVASNMSYFFLMGQMGLAFGPFLAGILLDLANPSMGNPFVEPVADVLGVSYVWDGRVAPLLVVLVMAIPPLLLMYLSVPHRVHNHHELDAAIETQVVETKPEKLDLPYKAFAVLGMVVILRSLAQPGSVAFIPVLFQHKGWSPAEYGAITSSYWIASGISGVVFGNLADHYGRRAMVALSLVSSAPMFFFLPLVDGPLAFAMAIMAGGFAGGSHSIIVVLAQELIPNAKGFASGSILGFIFGSGAIGSFLIGTSADIIGLGTTFQLVAVVTVVAAGMALALPAHNYPKSPAPESEAELVGASD